MIFYWVLLLFVVTKTRSSNHLVLYIGFHVVFADSFHLEMALAGLKDDRSGPSVNICIKSEAVPESMLF